MQFEATTVTPESKAQDALKINSDPANVVVEPTPEVKPDVKPEPPKEKDSARFAALAKKENQIVQRQSQFKLEREKFEAEKAEVAGLRNIKKTALESPGKALEILGLTYKQVTDWYLHGEKPTPELMIRSLEERINEREAVEAKAKADAEAKAKEDAESSIETGKRELEEARTAWRGQFTQFVSEKAETYELSNLYPEDSARLADELMWAHFEKTQRVLSNEEAASQIEKHFETIFEKVTATKKFQSKATPQATTESSDIEAALKQSQSAQPRTLNNNMTSSAQPPKALSREERIKRALAIGK